MPEQPKPEFIAAQLRMPEGEFASIIGEKMNEVNEFLYDFIIENMELKPNDSILEIGFGNGKFFDKLFDVTNLSIVCGIDYSDNMVEAAKTINSNRIGKGKLILKAASSDKIPFDSKSFDKVLSSMVIYFWDSPEDHLREIHRVLKPGGKLFTGIRSKNSMKQFPFSDYGFKLYEEAEWEKILEENNFKIISTIRKEQQLEIDNDSMMLESICFIAETD